MLFAISSLKYQFHWISSPTRPPCRQIIAVCNKFPKVSVPVDRLQHGAVPALSRHSTYTRVPGDVPHGGWQRCVNQRRCHAREQSVTERRDGDQILNTPHALIAATLHYQDCGGVSPHLLFFFFFFFNCDQLVCSNIGISYRFCFFISFLLLSSLFLFLSLFVCTL